MKVEQPAPLGWFKVAPEWQPLATAPLDGTDILVASNRIEGGFQQVVFWDSDGAPPHNWQTADGISYHRGLFTHWQPLPEPPK